jgi:calcineurin-like phosphoesterase
MAHYLLTKVMTIIGGSNSAINMHITENDPLGSLAEGVDNVTLGSTRFD